MGGGREGGVMVNTPHSVSSIQNQELQAVSAQNAVSANSQNALSPNVLANDVNQLPLQEGIGNGQPVSKPTSPSTLKGMTGPGKI